MNTIDYRLFYKVNSQIKKKTLSNVILCQGRLILLAPLRLLVEENKRTEQIEDSKRSRIWSYQWLQDRNQKFVGYS